jgi:hypothetical protein
MILGLGRVEILQLDGHILFCSGEEFAEVTIGVLLICSHEEDECDLVLFRWVDEFARDFFEDSVEVL